MAVINFETRPESSLDETDRIAERLAEVLDELSGDTNLVQNYIISSGMQFTDQRFAIQQPNLGMIWVQFNPTSLARKDPEALLSILREAIREHIDTHEDIRVESFTVSAMGTGLEATEAVVVRVEHGNLEVCRSIAGKLEQRLGAIPGVTGIDNSLRRGPLQLSLRAREPQCSEFGLTESDVALSVRAATEGMSATSLRNSQRQDEQPVRVLLEKRWRDELRDLMEIPLKTPTGAAPRLEEVAEPYYEQHYASLHHNNGRPSIVVNAVIPGKPKDAQGQPIDVGYVYRQLSDDFDQMRDEHPGLVLTMGGGYAQRQEAFGQLRLAGLLAAMLIYVILLAQFRSYLQPFLVLFTLVFSFVGVITGLVLHDYAFSVVSAVALVGLFGVAVNDAIILIDFINKAPRDTSDRLRPVLEGCRLRLRPILVTTITTVAGLLPMAIGLRGYSSIWSPFAACFCYGLTSATLLTLVMMPCFYLICDDLGRAPSWFLGLVVPNRRSPTSAAMEES
jgi:HAE1 family hydrophobic/amphiphilic exporter-1